MPKSRPINIILFVILLSFSSRVAVAFEYNWSISYPPYAGGPMGFFNGMTAGPDDQLLVAGHQVITGYLPFYFKNSFLEKKPVFRDTPPSFVHVMISCDNVVTFHPQPPKDVKGESLDSLKTKKQASFIWGLTNYRINIPDLNVKFEWNQKMFVRFGQDPMPIKQAPYFIKALREGKTIIGTPLTDDGKELALAFVVRDTDFDSVYRRFMISC